jgi:hypothetical protein
MSTSPRHDPIDTFFITLFRKPWFLALCGLLLLGFGFWFFSPSWESQNTKRLFEECARIEALLEADKLVPAYDAIVALEKELERGLDGASISNVYLDTRMGRLAHSKARIQPLVQSALNGRVTGSRQPRLCERKYEYEEYDDANYRCHYDYVIFSYG